MPPHTKGNIAVPLDLPALFKGYYKDEERTKAASAGEYYVTGDLAHKDEDGYFWFEGRRDDIIISSGYTIGPFEVEDALTNHPAVKECAVVASPHEIRGNIVKAFVILQNDYNGSEELIKELQTFCKMKLRHTNIQERLNLLTTYLRQIQEKSDVLNYATQKLQKYHNKN